MAWYTGGIDTGTTTSHPKNHKAASRGKSSTISPTVSSSAKKDRGKIRIRMYRVGFGDCFLISFLGQEGKGSENYHILVDCGVHSMGNIGKIEQIVDDIITTTGKKIAVVIATHAHQDHISGFSEKFKDFEIGEVWLPWTWDPSDPQAIQLQKKQIALIEQLNHSSKAIEEDQSALSALSNLTNNETAISLLKSGFGVNAKVRYLKAGDKLPADNKANDSLPIPGLSVSILGPPTSEESLAKMDPPPGDHYLQLSAGLIEAEESDKPFNKFWVVKKKDKSIKSLELTIGQEKELREKVRFPLSELAFALDQARNNESVVAFMAFKGQNLLFAGDAQYGNWKWWMDNLHQDNALSQVTFYKVAHHGSVNGTPVDALEKMTLGKFTAMVSTQSKPWPSIPRIPLMAELDNRTQKKVVRSDWLKLDGAPDPSSGTEPPLPSSLPTGFEKGPLWIDYYIQL